MTEMVPESWTIKRLSEFSKAHRGTTYVASELSEDRERYPLYINMKSFKVGGGYNEKGDKYFSSPYSPNQIVRENDLLIANTDVTDACDILGAAVYLPREKLRDDVLFSHHVSALNVADDVDVNFLSFLFGSENLRLEMKRCGRGTTVKMLDMKDIGRISFAIPPLPEQKKIASILTSVDEVIENTQKQIAKLQDLKKATMNELLTKGIGHTEFKDSELGRIPKSWRVLELNECVDRIVDCEHKTAPEVENSNYFVVSTNAVRDGQLIESDLYNTSEDAYTQWTTRAIPSAGDVMFTREAPAGESCCVPKNKNVCLGQRMVLLKPNIKILDGEFLNYFFCSERGRNSVYQMSLGTTVSRINMADISKLYIPLPTLSEQSHVARIINEVDIKITMNKSKKEKFGFLKKSLMQDLLTGKVRVENV